MASAGIFREDATSLAPAALSARLRQAAAPAQPQLGLLIDRLSVRFGARQALDQVSFVLNAGEVTSLLGPNGAGKSTLLHVLCRQLAADEGAVTLLDGRAVPRRCIGFVSQDVRLYPTLSVAENLQFFGELHGRRRIGADAAFQVVRDQLQLDALWRCRVGQLSGGQKRLVHIAASLVHEPQILVLDEPTAALDQEARKRVAGLARAYAQSGRVVIYATHHLDEVEAAADRVIVLVSGKVLADERYDCFIAASSQSLILVETDLVLDQYLACEAGDGTGRYVIESGDPARELPAIVGTIQANGGQVFSARLVEPNLKSAIARLLKRIDADVA